MKEERELLFSEEKEGHKNCQESLVDEQDRNHDRTDYNMITIKVGYSP